MKKSEKLPNSKKIHLQLGDKFYRRVKPARFPSHKLRYRNQDAAEQIGLGDLDPDSWENHFAKFSPFENSLPEPDYRHGLKFCYGGCDHCAGDRLLRNKIRTRVGFGLR